MGIQEFIIYAQLIRRRWKPIVGLVLGTMVTLVCLYIFAPRVYLASARLHVIASPPSVTTLYGGFHSDGFREEVAYTQGTFVEILKSRIVAQRTIEATGAPLSVEELQERTEIEIESDFIKLTITDDSTADEAAQLTNELAAEALAYYGELLATSSDASGRFVSAQLELARQELDRAQTNLMRFKIENKVGSLDDDVYQQTSLIRSLNYAHDDALASNDTAKANTYAALIAQRERELQSLLNLGAEYQALETAVAQASDTYSYLLDKEAEAKITENQIRNVSFILMVEPATPPRQSTSSFSTSILVLGGALSLVLGVAIAFVWEYIEANSIRQEGAQADSLPQQQPTYVD
jgi:uncharacterized protein involved in exopolysaccharide biosynthesis